MTVAGERRAGDRAWVEAVERIDAALLSLRHISAPGEVLARAAAALCTHSAFSAAVVSTLEDGRLRARSVVTPSSGGDAATLAALRDAPFPVRHPMPEAALLRSRRAGVVGEGDGLTRSGEPWARVLGWRWYVAAPLVAGRDGVVGMVHAHPERPPERLDADVAAAFARGAARIHDVALLRRAVDRHRAELRVYLEAIDEASRAEARTPLRLADEVVAPHDTPRPAPAPDDRSAFDGLTRRELDVLRLVVRGASNREIADRLVVTESTVKSHVVRVLRKLGAESRAAAAAEYHRRTATGR